MATSWFPCRSITSKLRPPPASAVRYGGSSDGGRVGAFTPGRGELRARATALSRATLQRSPISDSRLPGASRPRRIPGSFPRRVTACRRLRGAITRSTLPDAERLPQEPENPPPPGKPPPSEPENLPRQPGKPPPSENPPDSTPPPDNNPPPRPPQGAPPKPGHHDSRSTQAKRHCLRTTVSRAMLSTVRAGLQQQGGPWCCWATLPEGFGELASPRFRWPPERSAPAWLSARRRSARCPPPWTRSRIAATGRAGRAARTWRPRRSAA